MAPLHTPLKLLLARLLLSAAVLPLLVDASSEESFRPPAIPLFTTDPYMQTWIMGSNATADVVRHWDQTPKEMLGFLRIGTKTYRFLGACTDPPLPTPPTPGPAEVYDGHNVAPGKCDLLHFPATPDPAGLAKCNEACYGHKECQAGVLNAKGICYLKTCVEPRPADEASTSFVITGSRPAPPPTPTYCTAQALTQLSVSVMPTITTFELQDAAATFSLNVSFISSMFADDYARLSRPVYTLDLAVRPLQPHVWDADTTVKAYIDLSAQHVVNEDAENVTWQPFSAGAAVSGVRIGTAAQCVLCAKGDKTNINWGHLYLGVVQGSRDGESSSSSPASWAGSAQRARSTFFRGGGLPAAVDDRHPRSSDDDMPVVAAAASLDSAASGDLSATIVLAYDDVASVRYYGTGFRAWWTTLWPTIEDAIRNATAPSERALAKARGDTTDPSSYAGRLMQKLQAVGCSTQPSLPVRDCKYALIGSLAYRQTLAATKLVVNNETFTKMPRMINFLKEISTNGDMQTMDVVFPASPMLLYTNAELLKLLLIPVLNFANNDTDTPFSNPFSPHQIGTYPIADATTASQEPMPMENTGNMFLMLAGVVQRQPAASAQWLTPYMPMLTSWAEYLIKSLPFPANQLCTDDFTGRLANNTNLAAKGIVALEAFSQLCRATDGRDCQRFSGAAAGFVRTWTEQALEQQPRPHYKIAYNFPNSYSIKYNLVWQKLLNYSAPFPWKQVVAKTEVPYYLSHANQYGPPMDSRHTYVKLDWLAWGATMADTDAGFHAMMDPIFAQANATSCRVPLTDLFDTVTATCAYGKKAFVARPVVGGVYAKMLAPDPYPF
jgi:hypothetical protein